MQATSSTHRPYAVPPSRFRDQATGVGNTVGVSAATGAARKACVELTPAAKRAVAPAQGYARG